MSGSLPTTCPSPLSSGEAAVVAERAGRTALAGGFTQGETAAANQTQLDVGCEVRTARIVYQSYIYTF